MEGRDKRTSAPPRPAFLGFLYLQLAPWPSEVGLCSEGWGTVPTHLVLPCQERGFQGAPRLRPHLQHPPAGWLLQSLPKEVCPAGAVRPLGPVSQGASGRFDLPLGPRAGQLGMGAAI